MDQTALRLDSKLLERADRIAERLEESDLPGFQALGTVNRSFVLRFALARGLDALEQELGLKKGRARGGR